MHLHLDGIIFSLQQHGGISVYFRELLRRFTAADHAVLTVESPLKAVEAAESFSALTCVERPGRRLERMRRCRDAVGHDVPRADVFHSSYYRRPAGNGVPTVVTVHDFVAHRFLRGARGRMRTWLMNSAIAQARHIICISEATREDLMEFVGVRSDQRVSVIHNGVSALFRPLTGGAARASPDRSFALFVGQRAGYKNFSLALRALEHLPDLVLYCVGGGALQPAELAGVSESTRARVQHLGFVADERLNMLYNQAHCLVYPSTYEGFGIPVLEAMRAGCPVVSVDCKAVLEVGGLALSVSEESEDPVSLTRAIERLHDTDIRSRLRELGLERSRQFSWDRCFEQTMATYHDI